MATILASVNRPHKLFSFSQLISLLKVTCYMANKSRNIEVLKYECKKYGYLGKMCCKFIFKTAFVFSPASLHLQWKFPELSNSILEGVFLFIYAKTIDVTNAYPFEFCTN